DAIAVWDVVTGERRCTLRLGGGALKALALSADGETVVAATGKVSLLSKLTALTGGGSLGAEKPPRVRVLDVATETCRHELPVEALDLAVSWDGLTALVAVAGALEVWDLGAGRCTSRIATQGVKRVVMTPDARHAVSAHDDRSVRLWDVVGGKSL